MLLLMTAGTTAAMAADWVLNEDKYSATHYTDHLYLEVFLADLDWGNTYCQEGTVTATNGSKSVDLLKFKYINEGDDENETAEVKAQLVMPNAKAYFTNSSGSSEIGTDESSYWLKKWGSDNHYMTAKVDFYYSSEMAGGGWKIYFHFKHSDGKWYDKTLSSWVGTSDHLGLYDYDWKSYKIERTGIDKLTFTVPQLPNDIDSKLSSVRMRQATYDVVYTFVKQDGTTATLSKTYEAGSNEKNEEVSFPDGVGNPARINYKVTAVHGVKDPSNWFNRRTNSDSKEDAFKIVPAPGAITTEYHQFDHQTVLTWTTPKDNNYLDVTPYIYRIQTDANGNPKSGASWSKRGALTRTSGGAMTFTDDDAEIGTYYKYMVVNIPSDYIGNTGISEASLNNLSDDLLSKVGSNSALVNTAPVVTIYNLQQDTTQKSSVYLTWQYSRVPVDDASVTFKILRRTTADGPWSEYDTASGDANPAAGVKLPYEDKDLPNSIVRYQYKVRLELAGGYRFESLPVTAGLLAGAKLIDFTATKGVHANVVTLAWKAQQAGTANCNFIISRRYLNSDDDFIQIYSYNGADANYSYDDINAMPGYYYEYRAQLFEAGVLQSTLYAVGFSQARGAVGGRVSFGTGTAVPGVRLWLRPADTGNGNTVKTTSQYVYGASEGIAWKASETEIEKIFGSKKDYTVQFFVRPEEGMNDGAVLANIPGVGLITLKKNAGTVTDSVYNLCYERYGEKIIDLSTLTGDYTAQDKDILMGTLNGNYKISIADGATVCLRNVTINGTNNENYKWAGITCPGNATIVLEGNNTIKGFHWYYPGIYIAQNKTLTIKGTGSLNASSNGYGCGIGGGFKISCGNIVIEGGDITAEGGGSAAGIGGGYDKTSCGDITITGGTIIATGGYRSPGIGSGTYGSCGNITIANSVTKVIPTKGDESIDCVGRAYYDKDDTYWGISTCGTITFGSTVHWDGSNYTDYWSERVLTQTTFTDSGDGSWESSYTPVDFKHNIIIASLDVKLPVGKYSLLTLSKTGNRMSVQVDKGAVQTFAIMGDPVMLPFSLGGAEGITDAQAFKGNFAEVRVYKKILEEAEKNSYFDRTLTGREKDLALYWPLDEGLERYAFDASYLSDQPNGRHATVGKNITPSVILPAEEQLSRYGVTSETGDYSISGIPFLGSGSTYTVVPEKGIHKFNPTSRSFMITPNVLTMNNIDFTDESSFPMTGHIYYAGTNIPAEGIQLSIDGMAASANGKALQTDANGYYSISVPIGEHYVEAQLMGHTLVDGGRFPIEGTYNFADRVQHDFIDSTLVNFVGRVAGAKYNDTIPVGFGESHNNIGAATITLKLNNASFSFNCENDYITPAKTVRTYESDTASIRSHAWTDAGAAEAKYIKIVTDSLTGEFSALLPPLKYVMQSVVVEKNGGVEFTALSDVDLTNPSLDQTDSICRLTEQGDTVYNHYSYNTKKVLTYYSTPQVDVAETGHAGGAFGLDSVIIAIDEEHNDTVRNLYTLDSLGIHYMFGYPVYKMLDGVEYAVHAYETYTNYDGALPVTDTVNLNGQELTIGNEMSSYQQVIYDAPEDSTRYTPGEIYEMMYNKITLDRNGRARIPWTVGLPNIVKPFSRHFNITLKRDDRTYEPYRMDAIVLGALTTGNNFVTKGPDNVKFILRDPYGAHSYTTLKTGTVRTVTKYDSWEVNGEHSLKVDVLLGTSVTTATGIGVAVINTNKVATEITAGAKSTWSTEHKKDSVFQTTTVESVSTSGNTTYVGAKGDVYVGTSNNILIGTCRKVQIKQNVQTGKYEIVLDDALAMGEKVSTSFAYSQYELEKVMIPKWKDQRKQFLTQVASEQAARSYVNTGKRAKCVTWLDPSASNYGEAGTYVFVAPQNPEKEEVDSVEWCNNQITAWQNCIRRNEEAKIKAINGGNFKNYSIDGGSSRTYTHRNDTTGLNQSTTTYNISALGGWKQGWQIKNFAFIGIQTNLETSVGGGQTTGTGDDNGRFTEWEYVLSDGNRDVDISMNVYDAECGNNSKIFSLFGGQTYNPYEPADSTHYYTNAAGQYLPLGNTTVRMEQPFISIGKVNEAPGKHTTLTDIPAGQTATAILYCTNMGNTNQGRNFSYDLSISESTNPHGLEILMDGTPITDRAIYLEQGQTTQKVITVRQTDESILDFDSIELWFASQYQPLTIYDVALLSAHFVPSSSPVDLTIANPVLNTDPTTGKGLLQMKISGINRQFKNLKKVGVQYRFAGNTQWTTFHTWVVNEEDLSGKDCEMLPPTGDLKLNVDMEDNISYPEGDYEFRAFTMTPYGHEEVYAYSEVTKVIKDMTLPRPLYTPAPANGILGIGEQLAVEFNEDIVPGYVGDKNIIVTAKLNGQPIDHEVSMHIRPYGEEVKTENPLFLSGNFSMEFWLKHYDYGTILRQGGEDGNFGLSIDRDGFVEINIAGAKYSSEKAVPMDEWTFFAMNYKAETMTFNMIAQYGDSTIRLFTDQVVSDIDIDKVSYSDDNYLYLGPIDANIHDLAIYNIYRDALTSAADKYVSKDTYTYGLTNYWRMDEGHGFVAADARRTHNLIGKDAWDIINTNYALRMDSMAGAQVDISLIPTRRSDSYAIELWYNPALFNGVDTVFETAIPTVMGDMQLQADKLCLRYDTAKNLVLDYGVKSRTVASHTDFPDVSGWHHFALNVVRGQAASFYLDGARTAVIAEADVPNLSGSTLVFAKNADNAYIDELRIWKATLSEDRLLSNMYNTIDTADLYSRGLVAYYPFEKDSTINGVATKGETLENMAPRSLTGNAGDVQVKRYMAVKKTPPIKNAPSETRITAMPVASERKVVINLAETEVTARDLEGTTLNITMAEVHDLHGNMSEPIKWTAYVQQNTLLWAKDSVNITKQYGEDYTFDVTIENKSGQTEYYTVENMPSWLSLINDEAVSYQPSAISYQPSAVSDVQPLKTKTLRFAVNPLVPVGNYDVTIGVQGNKGILEPLRIVMKVRGETPNWTVDPTKYDHSMTIIGQVYLSGILMENPESMVAAFIGGECRGVAAPKKIRGAAYETLIIYGSDTEGADKDQPVTFRIWDASKGIAYTDANIQVPGDQGLRTTLIFRQDTMIGNFNTPAIWTKSDRVEQLIPVHENWNWIAFGVEPPSEYCDPVFTPQYKGWNVLVKDQETFSQSSGSTFNGPLKLAVNRMYKVRILRTTKTASATLDPQLSVSGKRLPSDSMGVMIEHGWNWLPYTPLSTMVVDEALAGVQPKWGDIIKSQTGVSVYDIYGWEGTLTALEPGHGYLYYSTDSTAKSFSYPDLTASVSHMQRKLMARSLTGGAGLTAQRSYSANGLTAQRSYTAYPSNMTMTIRLMDGEAVVDTCEIAAFIGGECRGAVRAHTDSLYYLVIAGDGAGQPMELRTVINGEERVIDKTLTFVSDNHIGTPWEPYVIQLNPAEGIEDVRSDDVRSTKVRKVLINDHIYLIRPDGEMYDVTGKRVSEK